MIEEKKFAWEKRKFLITAVGGAVLFFIGLWQFSITSRNDFAKPVLQKQLELCIDASEAAATLANDFDHDRDPNANAKAASYLALYYGKLAVVENQCVYNRMVDFKTKVFDKADNPETASRLALSVAFACRRMLSHGWNTGLLGVYDPQKLLESFSDLNDYKNTMQKFPECHN